MKKQFWIAGLFLIALVLVTEYDLTRRTMPLKTSTQALRPTDSLDDISKETKNTNKENKGRGISNILPEAKTKDEARQNFDNQFLLQARQIGQVQTDVETTEIELKKLSQRMQKSDIKKMANIAADMNVNGDERALAIELLSRNQTPEALKELENFIVSLESKNNQTMNNQTVGRTQEFETILRAQAIEGISIYPEKHTADEVLKSADAKISESFLKDRIARSRASLAGHAPTPEEQDETALRKLVE